MVFRHLALLSLAIASIVGRINGLTEPHVNHVNATSSTLSLTDASDNENAGVRFDEHQLYLVKSFNGKDWTDSEVEKYDNAYPEFDPAEYSKFKYGDYITTIKYAELLGQMFIKQFPNYFKPEAILSMPKLVVTGSAYKNMPVAATHLTNAFVNYINEYRFKQGMDPIETTKMYRHRLLASDFSKMGESDRAKEMGKNPLSLDYEFLTNAHLVVLDDCKITGSHRKNIQRQIEESASSTIQQTTYLYIASLDTSGRTTKVEDYMNHVIVKNLYSWLSVVSQPNAFEITARGMKYFMNNAENSERGKEMARISEAIPCKVIVKMYYGCINDGFTKKYAYGFDLIRCQKNVCDNQASLI